MNPASVPVRFSRLKYMAQSPAHYLHSISYEREDSASLRAGRLVHYLILGGAYAVYDGTRRGKAWDEFQAEHEGADIFTATELERAEPIAESVLRCSDAARLLVGEHEVQRDWSWLGRACTGRLDVMAPGWIVDLKTTVDAQPERFQRLALRYGYHAQLAWYRIGAGDPSRDCFLISVETKPPHPVVVHHFTEAALDQGERLCRLWIERLLSCEQSGQWPGYAQGIVDFDALELDDVTLTIDGEEVAA